MGFRSWVPRRGKGEGHNHYGNPALAFLFLILFCVDVFFPTHMFIPSVAPTTYSYGKRDQGVAAKFRCFELKMARNFGC